MSLKIPSEGIMSRLIIGAVDFSPYFAQKFHDFYLFTRIPATYWEYIGKHERYTGFNGNHFLIYLDAPCVCFYSGPFGDGCRIFQIFFQNNRRLEKLVFCRSDDDYARYLLLLERDYKRSS